MIWFLVWLPGRQNFELQLLLLSWSLAYCKDFGSYVFIVNCRVVGILKYRGLRSGHANH